MCLNNWQLKTKEELFAHLILGYSEKSEDIQGLQLTYCPLISDYSIYIAAGSNLGLNHDGLKPAIEALRTLPYHAG